jgi:hypothetical protein
METDYRATADEIQDLEFEKGLRARTRQEDDAQSIRRIRKR